MFPLPPCNECGLPAWQIDWAESLICPASQSRIRMSKLHSEAKLFKSKTIQIALLGHFGAKRKLRNRRMGWVSVFWPKIDTAQCEVSYANVTECELSLP